MAFIKTSSKIIRFIQSGIFLFVGIVSLFFIKDVKENSPNVAHADYSAGTPGTCAASAATDCSGASCAGGF